MKINIGCGRHVLDDWYNIDVQVAPHAPRPPELLTDIRSKVPLPDGCAEQLMAIHVLEHFYFWEAEGVLQEWARLLKPGGQIILELPNILKCAQNLLNDSGVELGGKKKGQLSMWGIYGDPFLKDPYMCHRWGWSPITLGAFLRDNGFINVKERETQFHPNGRRHRDMRVEAFKDG